jgi:hypothetical protein
MARAQALVTMRTRSCRRHFIAPSVLVALIALPGLARADAAETITATAVVKGRGGLEASAPVTVIIERRSTEAEREEMLAALRKGGTEAVRNLLVTREAIGSVNVGSTSTALKFIYERATAGGRLITAVAGSPIAFIGAGAAAAPPNRSGFDLGLVILDLTASGSSHGELMPATKVRLDEQGAIVTDDYSGDVVRLTNVTP